MCPTTTAQPDVKSVLSALLSNVVDIKSRLETHCSSNHNDILEISRLRSALCESAALITTRISKGMPQNEDEGTYFEHLPVAALENIMRFMSASPSCLRWPRHIAHDDLRYLYLSNSIFGKLFRSRFTSVKIETGPSGKVTRWTISKVFPPAMPLQTTKDRSDARKVLEMHGAFVTRLRYVGNGTRLLPPPYCVNWIDAFRDCCVSVKALSLYAVHESLVKKMLEKRGAQLESISISSSGTRLTLLHVAKYCTSLKILSIAPSFGVPHEVWIALADKLQDLTIRGRAYPAMFSEMTRLVRTHCRKIQRLTLEYSRENAFWASEVTELVMSYGRDLSYAKTRFDKLTLDQCKRIAAVCTKAVFDLFQIHTPMDTVIALEGRVRSLTNTKEQDQENIVESCVTLPQLREYCFHIHDRKDFDLLRMMLIPGPPKLTELKIKDASKLPDIEDVFATIMASRLSLRSLTVNWNGRQHAGLVDVIYSNPMLELVRLTYTASDNFDIELLMPALLQCSGLRELKIYATTKYRLGTAVCVHDEKITAEFISNMASKCLPLKRRGVFIRIFGILYNA